MHTDLNKIILIIPPVNVLLPLSQKQKKKKNLHMSSLNSKKNEKETAVSEN